MFGLSMEKVLLLALIAVILIGPTRLPEYAAKLARLVRRLKSMAEGAKTRMRDEMGPEFDEVDWKKLDPRQYDPRRIIREALFEDDDEDATPVVRPASGPDASAGRAAVDADTAGLGRSRAASVPLAGAVPPYDVEAT